MSVLKFKMPMGQLRNEINEIRAIATDCHGTLNHYRTYYFPTWEEKFSQLERMDNKLLKLEKKLDALTSHLLGEQKIVRPSPIDFVSNNFRSIDSDFILDSLMRIQDSAAPFKSGMKVIQIFSGDGSVGVWLESLGVTFLGIEYSGVIRSYAERVRPSLVFLPLNINTIPESLSEGADLVLLLFRRSAWSVDDAAQLLDSILLQPIDKIILSLPYSPSNFELRGWDFFQRIKDSNFSCERVEGSEKSRDFFYYLTRGHSNER